MKSCQTCHAEWHQGELLKPGKIANACCQECGFDARVHGAWPRIFTSDEFDKEMQP